MSTYYMENTKEAYNYCKDDRKFTLIRKAFNINDTRTIALLRIDMYDKEDSELKNHMDGVHANTTTVKGFLRHELGLKRQELDHLLYTSQETPQVAPNVYIDTEVIAMLVYGKDWKTYFKG